MFTERSLCIKHSYIIKIIAVDERILFYNAYTLWNCYGFKFCAGYCALANNCCAYTVIFVRNIYAVCRTFIISNFKGFIQLQLICIGTVAVFGNNCFKLHIRKIQISRIMFLNLFLNI